MKFIKELIRRWKTCRDYDWRSVPPPNVRCSRGGLEYW